MPPAFIFAFRFMQKTNASKLIHTDVIPQFVKKKRHPLNFDCFNSTKNSMAGSKELGTINQALKNEKECN